MFIFPTLRAFFSRSRSAHVRCTRRTRARARPRTHTLTSHMYINASIADGMGRRGLYGGVGCVAGCGGYGVVVGLTATLTAPLAHMCVTSHMIEKYTYNYIGRRRRRHANMFAPESDECMRCNGKICVFVCVCVCLRVCSTCSTRGQKHSLTHSRASGRGTGWRWWWWWWQEG